MNEQSLRAILRDPSYPQQLRFIAYRLLIDCAGGYLWRKACRRIEDLRDTSVSQKPLPYDGITVRM